MKTALIFFLFFLVTLLIVMSGIQPEIQCLLTLMALVVSFLLLVAL